MTRQLSLNTSDYYTMLKNKNSSYVTLKYVSFIGTNEVNQNQTDRM
jgi:hypothetical protein